MKKSAIRLSVIIPIYNEEDGILEALISNKAILDKHLIDYEVILSNDGSSDNSQTLIDLEENQHLYHRSLVKEKNEGFGSAVKYAIPHCNYDYILTIPVDNPLDSKTLTSFINNIDDNDLVIGYRVKRVGYTFRMRLNSYIYQKLISKLFKIDLIDYNWIHLYKRDIFGPNGISIYSKGIVMLAEVVIKAHRKKYKIKEIEVVQIERLTGVATASKLSTIVNMLKEIKALYKHINQFEN